MNSKPIVVVQGGQYGSEAKGLVAGSLCARRNINYAVRTGAINAGHTVYYEGKAYKMQQIPVGWVNPDTKLVIGPGAYIHPPTLARECEMVRQATGIDPRNRLYIDFRAAVHPVEAEVEAKEAGRHYSIGATGKGCAEAVMHKIRSRGEEGAYWRVMFEKTPVANEFIMSDVPSMLTKVYRAGASILLEGTQGTKLDLHLGPYPYTTSRQTTAAAWVAEAGLSPALDYEVVLVLRTFPIRVAGNSGPLPNEISWDILMSLMNKRREERGLPPLVQPSTIANFRAALKHVGSQGEYTGCPDPLNQHAWTERDRETYAWAISNLNADALTWMSRMYPESYAEFCAVGELTTVTRKLRRIAFWNRYEAMQSIQQEAPTSVALTFANYDMPWLWYASEVPSEELVEYINSYRLPVPVSLVGFGPEDKHLIPTVGLEAEIGG